MGTNNTIKMESKALKNQRFLGHRKLEEFSSDCRMRGSGYCPQPLEVANSFLSKKWTISIIITIGNFNRLRFNGVLDKVQGITAKTLSERLKELKNLGLLKRIIYHEIPPRVEYELSPEGKKLMKAITPLIEWSINKK